MVDIYVPTQYGMMLAKDVDPTGEMNRNYNYVLYSDYAALQAKLTEVEERERGWREIFEGIVARGHTTICPAHPRPNNSHLTAKCSCFYQDAKEALSTKHEQEKDEHE